MTAKTAYLEWFDAQEETQANGAERDIGLDLWHEGSAPRSTWQVWIYAYAPNAWWQQLTYHERTTLTDIPSWLQK